MNHLISIIFRIIPLAMAVFCFGFGLFIYFSGHTEGSITAGLVVIFLGNVCLSLFATAATIIRQLINKFNRFDIIFYPVLSYGLGLFTIIFGIILIGWGHAYFVPAHVIIGLGLIILCVSTVAKVSSKFSMIPVNSKKTDHEFNSQAFSPQLARFFYAIPIICSIAGWVLTISLLVHAHELQYLVAGSVLGGISAICTSLIGLVVSIVRQESNLHNDKDKHTWYPMILILGSVITLWGIIDIFVYLHHPACFLGWILIGLGLICFSISSKVILLAKTWKGKFELANRIPLIPIFTALIALFISCFLFQWSDFNAAYYVPARVVAGFGAICFTLFSIVSILESGTSK